MADVGAIETFIAELRERAKEKPALAPHVAHVEEILTKARDSAQKFPADFGHWWKQVEAVISDRSLSVKARLALLGPIADEMGKAFGRDDTITPSSGGTH
jgi:hypothetical protein